MKYKSYKAKILGLAFSILAGCFSLFGESSENLPKTEILGKQYYVYNVKRGESAYAIAKRFGWDVEEFQRVNPEVKGELHKGMKLYYPVEEDQIASETGNDVNGIIKHRVKKGENVYSISRLYNVPLEVIYKRNPYAQRGVKSGDIVEIPTDEVRQLASNQNQKADKKESDEKTVEKKERQNKEKRKEAFESNDDNNNKGSLPFNMPEGGNISVAGDEPVISENSEDEFIADGIMLQDSISSTLPEEFSGVKIVLLLDEPNSNKDIDFTRGVLVALSKLNDLPYKVGLKVIDGRGSSLNITEELDDFEPDIIVTTADKAFPLYLVDYGNTNEVEIVNVFDLKNDLYEENNSIIQILPPSSIYNHIIADRYFKDYKRRKLIMVGEIDDNDGVAQELQQLFGEEARQLSLEEFGSFEPDIMESYIIYSYATKKEEVGDFLTNVSTLSENNPAFSFRVIGRSNWIAMIDDFGDMFHEYNVNFPSRVWLDENSQEWKLFTESYESLFNGFPVRSIPNFAASGFDITKYFLPKIAQQKGRMDISTFPEMETLQSGIYLNRVNNGGMVNEAAYIISFTPDGKVEKRVVR
ncbi:MAG: LysM peptidoglycan-binding domain-containing protein [Muribaculaceae bacterium]|nr:LysM peptidoglycan-binding domain-containing protein [Muribaculaceae bacterium]